MDIILTADANWSACKAGGPPAPTDTISLNGHCLTLDGVGATYTCVSVGPRASVGGAATPGSVFLGGTAPYIIHFDMALVAPPAGLPLWEAIAVAVAAKLATIKVAAGYAVDVASVVRPTRTGVAYTPTDHGICLLQGEPRPVETVPGNPPAIEWELPIQLDLTIQTDATVPADTTINVFAAAVNAAMMADPQWGALALNTRLESIAYPHPADGIEGVTLTYVINCRTAENDWTKQI
nr:hypothetical protein [uncultured Rhodopila sp.]